LRKDAKEKIETFTICVRIRNKFVHKITFSIFHGHFVQILLQLSFRLEKICPIRIHHLNPRHKYFDYIIPKHKKYSSIYFFFGIASLGGSSYSINIIFKFLFFFHLEEDVVLFVILILQHYNKKLGEKRYLLYYGYKMKSLSVIVDIGLSDFS
jgi:hypothetical protein